jgi:hypothetical protein
MSPASAILLNFRCVALLCVQKNCGQLTPQQLMDISLVQVCDARNDAMKGRGLYQKNITLILNKSM